jgi:hypothetical protein
MHPLHSYRSFAASAAETARAPAEAKRAIKPVIDVARWAAAACRPCVGPSLHAAVAAWTGQPMGTHAPRIHGVYVM